MRTTSAAAVLTMLLSGTAPALAGAPPAQTGPSGPLEDARRATEQTTFEGVMDVRWVDGGVTRTQTLTVTAAHATLAVSGGNQVMAVEPFERILSRGGKAWEELWEPTVAISARPDASAQYQVTTLPGGPSVAGRPTFTVEIRQAGSLRERLQLDTATSLPLEREQYDDHGVVDRTLAFTTLTLGTAAPPARPAAPVDHTPRAVSAAQLASAAAPDSLPEGYRRLGAYHSADVLQVLYSDGIYDLSVFQQPGRLRRADLPRSGEPVAVGATTGVRYAWAGGQVVVWSAGGRVLTAVGDAPIDEVLEAVRAVPQAPARAPSLMAKLRRACRAVMEPLS
ncbi:MAG: hypothetical protein M3066_15340 [Actinomycetota bacterium]|nr:hypothetical protein [Actinomycetota bacterium]